MDFSILINWTISFPDFNRGLWVNPPERLWIFCSFSSYLFSGEHLKTCTGATIEDSNISSCWLDCDIITLLLPLWHISEARFTCIITLWKTYHANILSQIYNATKFYFDISFLENVLNHLFLTNRSSVSQASYRTIVLTISFHLFKKQTILWR